MIGFSRNAPLPTATIPKKSSGRLLSAARATNATLSITHGSRSRRHKLIYNDKATLNNLVRISELHQKQSHWTIENDLYGTPEKLAACRRFYESRRRPKKANRFLHNWFNREAQPGKGGGDGKKLTGDALTHANLSSWTPPVRPFGSYWLRPAKCILNKSPRRLSPSG